MSPTFSGNYPTRSSQHATMAMQPFFATRDHGHAAIRSVVKQQTHGDCHTTQVSSARLSRDLSLIEKLVRSHSAATSLFGCTSVENEIDRTRSTDRSKKSSTIQGIYTTRCKQERPTELHSEANRTTKEERKEPETLSKPTTSTHLQATPTHTSARATTTTKSIDRSIDTNDPQGASKNKPTATL